MAEDIRDNDPIRSIDQTLRNAIIKECRRQEESCLYTSATMFIWHRRVKIQKQFFVAAPIIIGGIAGLAVLKVWLHDWVIAVLAMLASLFPALADALKFETRADEIAQKAAIFKSLQDRFRQTAELAATINLELAERKFEELMERLDAARSGSITTPEWAFEKARKKIQKGHYTFAVDANDETRQG